jgi:hypothetical protein
MFLGDEVVGLCDVLESLGENLLVEGKVEVVSGVRFWSSR